MSKNKKQIYIEIFVAVVFGGLALFFSYKNSTESNEVITNQITTPFQPKVEPPLLNQGGEERGGNPVSQKTTESKALSVTVSAGNTTIYLEPNVIFYDALVEAKDSGKITFSGKNYPGLGFFVTDIGALHTGNGKSLLYYINGKQASVGVSSYTLKDGDVIEWKLE